MDTRKPLPLLALNHISRVCMDLEESYRFYSEVLGFLPVKRPSSFDFEGAWLYNYGVGLHLIKGCPPQRSGKVVPKSCHISFQAASLVEVESSLVQRGIQYVKNVVLEDGVQISQLFFHDPDNNMIEVCNCDLFPLVVLAEPGIPTAKPAPLTPVTPVSAPQPLPASLPLHNAAAAVAAAAAAAAAADTAPANQPACPSIYGDASTRSDTTSGSDDSAQSECAATSPSYDIVSASSELTVMRSLFSVDSASPSAPACSSDASMTSADLEAWPPLTGVDMSFSDACGVVASRVVGGGGGGDVSFCGADATMAAEYPMSHLDQRIEKV